MKHPTTEMMSRYIALYCRVSTDEQAREGVSLEEQQERLQAYCRAMGWSDEVVLFVDNGFSAKSTERPQLQKLLKEIEAGNVAKVMVTKLDRLSRRLLDLLKLIDLFQEHQVSFISISESFDTNTPSGRLTLQVLGAVAEFERERIRERVLENMFHAAHQGRWLTQSPYGYRLENKELVIDEKEAEVVKRVYDLFLEKGLGFYSIAKILNEEGIPSKQNKEWSIRSIKLMLMNPAYKGTLVWNRRDSSKKKRSLKDDEEWIVVEDCLPVIIDKSTWDSVQVKLHKSPIPPRAKTSPHLLGGLLKCGNCGSGMSIGWSGSPKNRYRVYRCSANKNKGTCTSKQYRADEVESWFKHGLLQLFESLPTTLIPSIVELSRKGESQQMEQKIRSAKNRYKRKVEAYTAGLIDLEDLQEEKERMEKVIKEASSTTVKEKTPYQQEELEKFVRNKISNIIDAIGVLPVEEAKAMIGTLVEKVIIRGEKDIEIVISIL
ncbi:site-specific DNA recombinase [Brevibacillus aydinogluensis]|jgi:site-specific DNA recombinase|uniref:recombinase family protein n=1 Tax=Brevibacillus aydinogluensis TaxID=927786 RepID=UPI0026A25BA7|nr:recombinase family protein [Brevibacillus aydinogluensis]MDT3417000.1 site-specific DNA recombinase [Brevibacillus aydinogluensis]